MEEMRGNIREERKENTVAQGPFSRYCNYQCFKGEACSFDSFDFELNRISLSLHYSFLYYI